MSENKPGLSNEAFIEKWRTPYDRSISGIWEALKEALDRLEALIGQGQEERDFNFKDALDSALFELLDKCRENCNHGCHTVDDDTAWDECPDHKFMTDEIDKLRKTNWPEVQERLSGGGDERWEKEVPVAQTCQTCGTSNGIHDYSKQHWPPVAPVRKWELDDSVVNENWTYEMTCPECDYRWDEDCVLAVRDCKPEVQDALNGRKA